MEAPKSIILSDGDTVEYCAPFQRELYECENFRKIKKIYKKIIRQKKPEGYFTVPSPVKISDDKGASFELSENKDFSSSVKVGSELHNLKKHTTYYLRSDSGEAISFTTDSVMPRWIYAEGFDNLRDFGGETTKDGRTIKQGMLYRGPRLEKEPLPDGIRALQELGIKTDLDLRKEVMGKLTASPLGRKYNFILHPCDGYEDFLNDNPKNIKYLIEYFADESLYPIYFHCHGGQDRTGTLAFMLGAILGLDDERLIREYEYTMLLTPVRDMSRSRKGKIKKFLKMLKDRDKNKALGENAVDFLRECGVSDNIMNRIRQLLLTK